MDFLYNLDSFFASPFTSEAMEAKWAKEEIFLLLLLTTAQVMERRGKVSVSSFLFFDR